MIAPYKVLAVALAAVGCTTSGRSESSSTAPPVSSHAEPSAAEPDAAAPNAAEGDPKLLVLRAELDLETRESGLAKEAHYRPLCDKDGYPLVGNVNRKGPPPGYQPSAFCADIRGKKAKRT